MKCEDFLSALDARDGGAPLHDDVGSHAASCPACARALAADALVRDGLRALRDDAARAPLPPRFARDARRAAETRTERPRTGSPVMATVALAASLLAAAALFLASDRGPTPAAPGSLAGAFLSPAQDAAATPVVWSNGDVDILAAEPPAAQPGEQVVALLVEWNL